MGEHDLTEAEAAILKELERDGEIQYDVRRGYGYHGIGVVFGMVRRGLICFKDVARSAVVKPPPGA